MNRGVQIAIGLIMLLFSFVLFLLASIPEKPGEGTTRVLGGLLFAILGFSCTFTFGRPVSTRIAMGLLSLFMIIMIVYILNQDGEHKSAIFAALVAMMSGVYAATGIYPDSMPFAEVFGKGKRKKTKKLKRS